MCCRRCSRAPVLKAQGAKRHFLQPPYVAPIAHIEFAILIDAIDLCKTPDCKAQRILNESDSADHCVERTNLSFPRDQISILIWRLDTCVLLECFGGRDESRSANANPELCNRRELLLWAQWPKCFDVPIAE